MGDDCFSPGMVQIPLVAEEESCKVGREFEFAQLVQKVVSVIEAIPVADTVHYDESFAPPDVVIKAPRCLQQKHTQTSSAYMQICQLSSYTQILVSIHGLLSLWSTVHLPGSVSN